MRVSLIVDNLGPYHVARLDAAGSKVDLTAIELRKKSTTYDWETNGGGQFSTRTLPIAEKSWDSATDSLERALEESCPDVVAINGWGDYLAPQAMRWCAKNGVAVVMMSESTEADRPQSRLKTLAKRRLVRMAGSSLVGGEPQKRYMVSLGARRERVFTGYDVVDNEFFSRASTGRKENGERAKTYFLASNRFIERKNLGLLIDAYAQLETQCDWDLCLLGDGELKGELIAQCRSHGLFVEERAPWEASGAERSAQTVFFPGFRQIDELPRFYAGAGCFVHPALAEPWGLVVNEAMASGLPVLVAERVGCAQDLVEAGVNGFTFDPADCAELASLLQRVAAEDFPLAEFGRASRQKIAILGPESFASGLLEAARTAFELGPVRPSMGDRILLNLLCATR